MRAFQLCLFGCLLPGCFFSFRNGDDDTAADGGFIEDARFGDRDATTWGAGECPWVGVYAGCGEVCDGVFDCPDTVDFEGAVCEPNRNWCVPTGLHRTFEGCTHPFTGTPNPGGAKACQRPDFVCYDDLRFEPTIESRDGFIQSGCVHISYCLADPALRPGFECYYSDLTRVREAPPAEDCPADVSSVFTFCGTSCDACPTFGDDAPGGTYLGCVGLSSERGVGVCAFDEACAPGSYLLESGASERIWGDGTDPTACLVQRDPETG